MNKNSSMIGAAVLATCLGSLALAACSSSKSNPSGTAGAAGHAGSVLAVAGVPGSAGQTNFLGSGGSAGSAGNPGASGMPGAAGTPSIAGSAGIAGGSSNAGTAGLSASIARLTATTSTPNVHAVLSPGGTVMVTVPVSIKREGGGDGAVLVTAEGLPPAVGALPLSVPAGTNTAQLQLQLQESATIGGPYPFTIKVASATDPTVLAKVAEVLYVAQPPGSLDASFGTSGMSVVKIIPQGAELTIPNDIVSDVAIDEQGRTIIGGFSNASSQRGWVARLGVDGTFDDKFGPGGRVTGFGQPPSYVDHLALSNNQLYVAARAQNSTATGSVNYLRKLTETGTSDGAFNNGLDFTVGSQIRAMAAFNGGMLIAPAAPLLVTAAGKADPAFVTPAGLTSVTRIAADGYGKILYADVNLTSPNSVVIGRLLGTGAADGAFGTGGSFTVACPADALKSVVMSIVGLGFNQLSLDLSYVDTLINCGAGGRDAYNIEGALVSYIPMGLPLTAFSATGDGRLVLSSPGAGIASLIQTDTKIVALYGTYSLDASHNQVTRYSLKRVTYNGRVDTTFGQSGSVDLTSNIPAINPSVMAYDANAQRAVIVGNDANGGLLLVRVWL